MVAYSAWAVRATILARWADVSDQLVQPGSYSTAAGGRTRVNKPNPSCAKLSAVPSAPIVNVTGVSADVAPGNCIMNCP